jgi:hypothetical protein
MTEQCSQLKHDGVRCQARAMHNSVYCFHHNQDPDVAEQRLAARRKGGKIRSKMAAVLDASAPDFVIKGASDVLVLLSSVINHVLKGRLDPRIGNCAAYVAATFNRVLETSEVQQQIEELTRRVEEVAPRNGRSAWARKRN